MSDRAFWTSSFPLIILIASTVEMPIVATFTKLTATEPTILLLEEEPSFSKYPFVYRFALA